MKKNNLVVVLGLLGLLIFGVIVTANPVEIEHWYWVPDVDQEKYLDMINRFNETHPEIQVNWENVPHGAYRRKFISASQIGAGPDTFVATGNTFSEFQAMNMLEPLDKYINNWDNKDNIYDSLWDITTIDNKRFAIPWKLLVSYMYYRADWFEEKGIEPPTTLEELTEAAQTLTEDVDGDGSIDRYGFGLRGGQGGGTMFYTFAQAWGVKLYDEQGNAAFNGEKALDFVQWYIDLHRKYKVTPRSAANDGFSQIIGAFKSGRTGMLQHHIGTHVEMMEALGDKVGVTSIPAGPGGNRWAEAGLIMHVINPDSDKKDAAWEFISFMSEEWAVRYQAKELGSIPILTSVADEAYFQDNRFFKASTDQIPYSAPWPPVPGWGNVVDNITPTLVQLGLMGEMTAEEIVNDIHKALKEAKHE